MSKPVPKKQDLNRILASLPPQDYRRLESHLEAVTFRRGMELHDPDKSMSHVYFPRSGVASVVTRLAEGGTIEVATIGNEGFVGLVVYLGNSRAPMEIFVQVPGDAVRMAAREFKEEIDRCGALDDLLSRYTQAYLTQVGQSAACNRVHPMVERCARWLLMSHDRVLGDEISLTHEYLAEMLGVRRASVTHAASELKRRKLIAYKRGTINIIDRRGLEKAACECYAFIRAEHERLIG